MNYDIDFLTEFLKELEIFSKKCDKIESEIDKGIQNTIKKAKQSIENEKTKMLSPIGDLTGRRKTAAEGYGTAVELIEQQESGNRTGVIGQIAFCEERLAEIEETIKNMDKVSSYNLYASVTAGSVGLEELKTNFDVFLNMVSELDSIQESDKRFAEKASLLSAYVQGAENTLKAELARLETCIFGNQSEVDKKRESQWKTVHQNIQSIDVGEESLQESTSREFEKFLERTEKTKERTIEQLIIGRNSMIEEEKKKFFRKFPPSELKELFLSIYHSEPDIDNYECKKTIPESIKIADMVYNISGLSINKYASDLLKSEYGFLTLYMTNNKRETYIRVPHCVKFDNEFNYLFEINSKSEESFTVDRVRSVIMKLFMQIPPSKINFLFFDPINLGSTFSAFARLVNPDDRTNKIINGQIWTSDRDIEDNLTIVENHISNVNQRCLQGKYKNIQQYNADAEENAEAYKIVTIMDFPASFNENSLKKLEKIISTGWECGVYTIIVMNDEQNQTIDDRLKPLVNNIIGSLTKIYTPDNKIHLFKGKEYNGQEIALRIPEFLSLEQLNKIVPILKQGIKSSDKVVISIDKLEKNRETSELSTDSTYRLKVPIGLKGAKETQYFTLESGLSNHAIIVGFPGMGKSSLIHTILFQSMKQYSPEDLQIYFVDLKRGVESIIYAQHRLPWFRVVSIESEREFAYNVLKAIDREQEYRSALFKEFGENGIAKIEQYNKKNKLPRILLIIDEFQEIFTENDEMAKKCSDLMQRIVKQGRAFGVHMILSSQSYVGAIDKTILNQITTRIVLKCSKEDANLLIENGGNEVDLISKDESGKAIYNSESGSKAFNTNFRVAYISPKNYSTILSGISERYKEVFDNYSTKILLSRIENNKFSIYNQFESMNTGSIINDGALYIGENMDIIKSMSLSFDRESCANLMLIGSNTEKARNMFAYSVLSLCINYYVNNRYLPDKPFIYVINYKPSDDEYFEDILEKTGKSLSKYVVYIKNREIKKIRSTIRELYEDATNASELSQDKYLFVFGYQRAIDLIESNVRTNVNVQGVDNVYSNNEKSVKDMFEDILSTGTSKGLHTVLWQDSCKALDENRNLISFFDMRIGFELKEEEYSTYLYQNDVWRIGESDAVLFTRISDNQVFRPYERPSNNWVGEVYKKLNSKPENPNKRDEKPAEEKTVTGGENILTDILNQSPPNNPTEDEDSNSGLINANDFFNI